MLVSWAVANPTPTPYTSRGTANMNPLTVAEIRSVTATIPTASRAMPTVTTQRGP